MIGGPARYFRHNAFEPELAQIKRIDKRIYRANRIALINPFIEAFGQQSRLPTIRPNQEALHRSPPANREENHNIQNVFTQPGSFASIALRTRVRLSPDFRHVRRLSDSSRCAIRRPEQVQRICSYSITSSAAADNPIGTSRPSALAVLRLMTSSNLVGCCTGKSAGFSPLRTLPA